MSVGPHAADARDGAKPLDQVGGVEGIFPEPVELEREASARESNDFDCRRFQSDPLSSEPVSENCSVREPADVYHSGNLAAQYSVSPRPYGPLSGGQRVVDFRATVLG
jgi:hypothetical protein